MRPVRSCVISRAPEVMMFLEFPHLGRREMYLRSMLHPTVVRSPDSPCRRHDCVRHDELHTVISSKMSSPQKMPPAPPKFDRNGHKNAKISPGHLFYFLFFDDVLPTV